MSERDPRAEAEVLIRKAEDDANAMRLLAPNAGISDEIIRFEYTHDLRRLIAEVTTAVGESPFANAEVVALTEHAVPLQYDEILDTEPIDREATVSLVNEVGDWVAAQLPSQE